MRSSYKSTTISSKIRWAHWYDRIFRWPTISFQIGDMYLETYRLSKTIEIRIDIPDVDVYRLDKSVINKVKLP